MTNFSEDLHDYSPRKLRSDAMAGLTVAMFAIPQAMAYAELAGIPVVHGLYSAIVVTAVASIFNSCNRLINGPTNAISIMIADTQLTHVMNEVFGPAPGAGDLITMVIMLTLLVGLIQLFGALLRLGDLANYISPSVVVGFTTAAAILIMLRQAPKLLGLEPLDAMQEVEFFGMQIPSSMGSLRTFVYTVAHAGDIQLATLALGGACTLFIVVYRRVRGAWIGRPGRDGSAQRLLVRVIRNAPGALFAIIAASLAMFVFKLDGKGIESVGSLPGRLPPLSWPYFEGRSPEDHLRLMRMLLPSALAIAIVGLIESVGIAKSISRRTRQKFDPNSQLWAEGFGNVAGAFFSSFAGSSSFTRSALNIDVGAETRFAGIFCGLFVAIFLLVLAPVFAYIPLVALSGVLIAVAFTLIETHRIAQAFRTSWREALIVTATAVWGIVFSLEQCILLGVLLSFLCYIPKAAELFVQHLIRDRKGVVREMSPTEPVCSALSILDIEGALFFWALPSLERALADFAAEPQRHKIVRIHNAQQLDLAACVELHQFIRIESEKGVTVLLCGIRPQHLELLKKTSVFDLLGPDRIFVEVKLSRTSTVQAVAAAYRRIGAHDCPVCTPGMQSDMDAFTYMI